VAQSMVSQDAQLLSLYVALYRFRYCRPALS